METTREERDELRDYIGRGSTIAPLPTEMAHCLLNDADRLSAIERDLRELADEYQSEPISDELRAILDPPEGS